MNDAALVALAERALLLCLLLALPSLLVAALCGGLVGWLQARLGVAEPTPPALARLLGGLLSLLLLAPWLGREIVRYASALWALLPTVGLGG